MTTIIYSFTGTGNTLAVARQLGDALGDTTIIPITRVTGNGPLPHDAEPADAIGIAFPVYYMDMPRIVVEFVHRLRLNGNPYIFGIATCGGSPGGPSFISTHSSKRRGPASPLALR
ncbi:hypothetical protein RJ53_10695 [Methanocalculus chunghsingensis]|uniref:Flavodoxin domain-containing protein n=1 Tax=Methanocalculus chunghsingensis TaxID=156457 RepID=A0A8J7W7I1_9EURY|nr:hypothetical protein [Methanocalculus chunghsingensis]